MERLDFRNFIKILKSATKTSYKTLSNSKSTAASGIKITSPADPVGHSSQVERVKTCSNLKKHPFFFLSFL